MSRLKLRQLHLQKLTFFYSAFFALLLGACRSGIETAGGAISGGGGGGGGISNDPVGNVNNEAGFYVQVYKGDKIKYWEHKIASFDEKCQVKDLSDPSLVDITCVIDVPELDLFHQGVSFQYNVPSSMCSYLELVPYIYINYPVGAAPTEIEYYKDKDGKIGMDNNADGVIKAADGDTAASYVSAAGTPVCPYDHTASDGPNCCEGKYTMTSYTWNATLATPAYDAAVTTEGDWGGAIENCKNSPAFEMPSVFELTDDGLPANMYFDVDGVGKNGTLEPARSPIKAKQGTYFMANYFNTLPNDPVRTSTNVPVALRSASSRYDAQHDAWQFICLDRGEEVKARIRLYVREWNMVSEFLKKADGDPDLIADEPSPGMGDVDDYADWDDLLVSTVNYPQVKK